MPAAQLMTTHEPWSHIAILPLPEQAISPLVQDASLVIPAAYLSFKLTADACAPLDEALEDGVKVVADLEEIEGPEVRVCKVEAKVESEAGVGEGVEADKGADEERKFEEGASVREA